jgi:hypothetical protein
MFDVIEHVWERRNQLRHRCCSVIGSITVKINRRVLRDADLAEDTAVPWWGGRPLHFEFA